MQSLIVRRGFTKQAAGEDGPSFEQQFGILANAIITDKLPQLDSMKLAFQLIDKNEDNSEAVGATVYLVGKTVVFVPAFFKNNKLKTGDMMFIANTQQFLPMSDPWLAWLKNKDLESSGEIVDSADIDAYKSTKGTTIREIVDPIIKTASVYLKGLLRTVPDMQAVPEDTNVLDATIAMGKTASEGMLDNLIKDTNFLNSMLHFYSGDQIDAFAKQAAALVEDTAPTVELILPLDKKAKLLTDHELKALYKDGFFIRKTASAEDKAPDVIRAKQLNGMFCAVTTSGKHGMLSTNGDIVDKIIFTNISFVNDRSQDARRASGIGTCSNMRADEYMEVTKAKSAGTGTGDLFYITEQNIAKLPIGAMKVSGGSDRFRKEDLEGIGATLDPAVHEYIPSDAIILIPNGTGGVWGYYRTTASTDKNGWIDADGISVTISDNENQVAPIITPSKIILPKGTKIVLPKIYNSNGQIKDTPIQADIKSEAYFIPVTMGSMDAFLTEYTKKKYNQAKIYSNGGEYVISGDNISDGSYMSIKEAAMKLVTTYNVDPAIAKVMLKEANNGASYNNPRASTYYIEKTAADSWDDANIPMSVENNKPPRIERHEMPTVQENPEQLQQAIQTAAQSGIKEVFDVTALKLLVRQNKFFDDITQDIPMFMKVLDSLCRKLFQFYWHTDKMEEKYGMVKMKALEENLKCTLDSLSELTIFFKLRTVDGTGATGDKLGDLMSGEML